MTQITIDQTALITDAKQRTWHALEREDGSISLYYTRPDGPAIHYVVWDELDRPLKRSNLKAIIWHLEQGQDNGGISREALAAFLRGLEE